MNYQTILFIKNSFYFIDIFELTIMNIINHFIKYYKPKY